MTRVLVVEDEESYSDALAYMLRKEGFEVAIAADGNTALTEFDRNGADIVLLDLMLPGIPGTEVCRQIRATSSVPVIMVSAKDDEVDKVVGLELGADDYVTKPYSPRELVARIRAVLRRGQEADRTHDQCEGPHAVPHRPDPGQWDQQPGACAGQCGLPPRVHRECHEGVAQHLGTHRQRRPARPEDERGEHGDDDGVGATTAHPGEREDEDDQLQAREPGDAGEAGPVLDRRHQDLGEPLGRQPVTGRRGGDAAGVAQRPARE